ISPLSKTAAILVSGFSAASFSFLASNRGLYSKIGRRFTKEGTSSFLVALICASHIFNALGPCLASGSGNCGSSGSTTMCFFSRVHPLSLAFRPLGFWVAFGSASAGGVSIVTAFLSVVEDAVDVADFVEGWASVGLGSVCLAGGLGFKLGLLVKTGLAGPLASVFSEESFPPLLEFNPRIFFSSCIWECSLTSGAVGGGFISAFAIFSVIVFADG
uniref:Uncharacterized protein n=1 Tax=Amphiprion ocellaris TaxID=80972 RepID=A0AAQ6A3D9_AMPOC